MSPLLRAWYRVSSVAIRGILGLLALVPVRLVLGFSELIARLFFFFMRERRQVAIDNILAAGITQDEREARRLALSAFRTFMAMVAEASLLRKRLSSLNWQRYVSFVMAPETEALLRKPGQGLLVASAHVGNWDIVARVASMIKPLTAIYRPFKNPYLDRAIHTSRSGEHLTLVAKYEDDPLRFVRTLRDGGALAIMIDQHARGGLPVDFFGRPAKTTPTVALLHLVTRMPILVAFSVRTGDLRYEIHAHGPFEFQRTGDRKKDVFRITQELTREIEKIARAHPEQYMWGHRRWKVRDEPAVP